MGIPSQPTTVISLGPRSGQPNSNRSLATEFGDSSPHALGDFYRGGPLVANHPVNSGVPTTIGGTRSLSQYNGASIVHRYTISSPVQNLNLFDYATNPARTGTTKSQGYIDNGQYTAGEPGAIEFTISPGVVVGSATRTQNALETGTGWHPSVSLLVINQGTIVGAGGGGGNGGTGALSVAGNPPVPAQPPQPGQGGGTAVAAQRPFIFQNAGVVRGGSGGGGGGGGATGLSAGPGFSIAFPYAGGGGGGGAGQSGGVGGTAFTNNPPTDPLRAKPGQNGGLTTGGLGGSGEPAVQSPIPATPAGGGGGNAISPTVPGIGQTGVPYPTPSPAPRATGLGGAAGFASTGDSIITWQQLGTINGQRIA